MWCYRYRSRSAQLEYELDRLQQVHPRLLHSYGHEYKPIDLVGNQHPVSWPSTRLVDVREQQEQQLSSNEGKSINSLSLSFEGVIMTGRYDILNVK